MTAAAAPEISVVIPVYNEANTVQEAMRRVRAFFSLKNEPWECLVVNDGSTDATREKIRSACATDPSFRLIDFPKNRGKGAAVRAGVLAARGAHILVTDVDLSTPIKESDRLRAALNEGNDVVIGSRALKAAGCDVQQSSHRRLSGRIFNAIVKAMVLKDFLDTQCGFKCFRREAAQKLFSAQKLDGFSFDVEILWLARKAGMRVKEMPVMWRQGEDSKVRLFRDSFRMVKDLFRLKTIHGRK